MPVTRSASRVDLPGYTDGRLHLDDDSLMVLTTSFDVGAYTRNARGPIKVDPAAVDLPDDVRFDLSYLWRVEQAALGDMRRMLASWTANEARITAFLGTWAYERYWNARALEDLLKAGGHPGPEPLPHKGLHARALAFYVEYLLPGVASIGGILVGEPVTAGHMARMAYHEGALQAAYRPLLPRLEGEARRVVSEIIDRRADFVSFFRKEAEARVRRSTPERLSARLAVIRTWSPLRPDGVPDPEETVAYRRLFGSRQAKAEVTASDRAIGRHLPGRPAPTVRAIRRAMGRSTTGRRHRGF